jgi:secreted trypsin-like serine protease
VLTVAHCVEVVLDQSKSKVKLASNTVKFKYGFRHNIGKMIVHEKFKFLEYVNSIALVKVV